MSACMGYMHGPHACGRYVTLRRVQAEYVETLCSVMVEASSEERFQVIEAVQAVREALAALRDVAGGRD